MANTQRLEVLQVVRQAKTAVRNEGSGADLNKQQKAVLEKWDSLLEFMIIIFKY